MKWQIFRDDSKFTTKDHEHEYQYWKFISEDLKWVFPLYARQGTELHEILEVDSVEESLWFLENCEEEYEGEKLCNHSIEEIYYGYDNNIETHGVIYKMKLDNGMFVSIREVYTR